MPIMSARKVDVFGVGLSVTDYQDACNTIIAAAKERRSFAVSALAVHGLVEATANPELRDMINTIDLVTPDGQPVRWAMNLLHNAGLRERVCGSDLTWMVCREAARAEIGLYVFGSTRDTCERLVATLENSFPGIRIVGVQPDRFRDATAEEDEEDVRRINASGAGIVLVGRGCPRQERWVAMHRGRVHAAMLAVGAAFDYFAGNIKRPPRWMQRAGLEWSYRLLQEPRRLLGRYLVTNSKFLWRLGLDVARNSAGRGGVSQR